MRLNAEAVVCAVRAHGETGCVVRLMTAPAGLVAVHVAGGRGRVLRPVLIPGNRVATEIAARSPQAMPFAKVELLASRAPLFSEPLPAAAIGWLTALTASALPERHPYPPLYVALDAALDAVAHAPSARGWLPGLLAYEALMLRELGYGAVPAEDDPQLRLRRQGTLIARHLFAGPATTLAARGADVMGARERLADLIARIVA